MLELVNYLFRLQRTVITLKNAFKSDKLGSEEKAQLLAMCSKDIDNVETIISNQFDNDANLMFVLSHIKSIVSTLSYTGGRSTTNLEFKDCFPTVTDYNVPNSQLRGNCFGEVI